MGTVYTHATCDTVTLGWRQNGPGAEPIPGLYVVITGPGYGLGPLPVEGTVTDVQPETTYTVTFWMTDGLGQGVDLVWGSHQITTPALLTDCQVDTTVATTTTQAQATTSEPASTTTTVAPASSTINPCLGQNFDQPTGTWGCYPTTAPPAIDIVQVGPPPTLPATGIGGGETAALVLAGSFLLAGAVLTLVTRRRDRDRHAIARARLLEER